MTARRLSAAERVLLALGIIALVRAALGWFLPAPREDFVLFCLLLAGQQLLLYGLPGLLLKIEKRNPTPSLPEEKERLTLKTAGAIAGTAAVHQGALTLVTLILGQWLAFMGFSVQQSHLPLPGDPVQGCLAVLAFCLIPALCEEYFFRGRLFPGLQAEFSQRASLFVAAGLFGLMHGQLAALPAHLAAGLMLTLLCQRYHLGASILYHGVFNCVSLALGLWERDALWQEELMAHPSLLMALAGLLVLLGAVCGWALSKDVALEKEPRAPRGRWAWVGGVALLLLPAYLIELLPR